MVLLSLCVSCLSCLLYSDVPFNMLDDNQTIQFSNNSLLPPFPITITYSIRPKLKRAFANGKLLRYHCY